VLRGGAWNAASFLVPQLYLLVASVAAARFLGPDGMGRQSFIAFIAFSLTSLLTGAMPVALSRFIAETLGAGEPAPIPDLLSWARRVEIVGAALAASSLTLVALLGGAPAGAWVLAGGASALAILQAVPAAALGGMQRWRPVAIVGLTTGALVVVATIAVLAAGGGITGMFAVEFAASGVGLTATSLIARRAVAEVAPRPASSPELRRRTRRFAAIGTYNVLINLVVWRRSEFLFLKHYSSDAEIAFYSIAFAGVAALVRIPEAIGTAITPAFSTLFGARALGRMRSGYARALRLSVVAALPLTAAAVALGPELIRLVYGDDYTGAQDVLRILIATFPVISLEALSRSLIVGLGRQRVVVIVGTVAASLNILLDFLLIPEHGATGAAIANTIAQLGGGLPLLAYATLAMRPVRWEARRLLRLALAAALAGAAAGALVGLIGGAGGVAAGALVGLVVLVGLGLALGALPRDDADWLAGLAPRWLARPVLLAGRASRHNPAA
jgi:O-antigen/teichoic acid export membrane protein